MIAATAVLILFISVSMLYKSAHSPEEQRMSAAADLEPSAMHFLQDPETASYPLHSASEQLGEGIIWLNESSGELFVLLDGLLPSHAHDVQVWAVNEHDRVNLGLMHHDRASLAHLYVKGDALSNARHIALTVEPVGGSLNPTAPDVVIIHFRSE